MEEELLLMLGGELLLILRQLLLQLEFGASRMARDASGGEATAGVTACCPSQSCSSQEELLVTMLGTCFCTLGKVFHYKIKNICFKIVKLRLQLI